MLFESQGAFGVPIYNYTAVNKYFIKKYFIETKVFEISKSSRDSYISLTFHSMPYLSDNDILKILSKCVAVTHQKIVIDKPNTIDLIETYEKLYAFAYDILTEILFYERYQFEMYKKEGYPDGYFECKFRVDKLKLLLIILSFNITDKYRFGKSIWHDCEDENLYIYNTIFEDDLEFLHQKELERHKKIEREKLEEQRKIKRREYQKKYRERKKQEKIEAERERIETEKKKAKKEVYRLKALEKSRKKSEKKNHIKQNMYFSGTNSLGFNSSNEKDIIENLIKENYPRD